MSFWLILAGLAAISGLWIAAPFLRRGALDLNDSEAAISVFRDQVDEVDRDLAAGQINDAEAESARREIEGRALKAARHLDGGLLVVRRSFPTALILGLGVAVAAVALYYSTGRPGTPDLPLAARQSEELERRANAGDVNARIQLLIERTADNPDSFEDWWTLASSYSAIGDYTAAVGAYQKAAELGGDQPSVLSAYAEAMVLANGNKVPQASRLIFEQILAKRPDPRARYYVALARAQAQDFQGAIDAWASLAQESRPDAPWMALVRRDIVNMARFLEVDVTDYLPDATPGEIAKAGGAAGTPEAEHRIAALEAALADDPLDHQAWIELATLRAQGGDPRGALAALDEARGHYRAAPFVLGKLDEAARALGLDIVETAPGGTRGPTQEDIAAAADMTPAEQDEMVSGMVDGLAARLAEDPNDPDGWVMLVRSYAMLGQIDKAREAYRAAQEVFAGDDAILSAIASATGDVVGGN